MSDRAAAATQPPPLPPLVVVHVAPIPSSPFAAAELQAVPLGAPCRPAAPQAPDEAISFIAGFGRLAEQQGCAVPAPFGGSWLAHESTRLLEELSMRLW